MDRAVAEADRHLVARRAVEAVREALLEQVVELVAVAMTSILPSRFPQNT